MTSCLIEINGGVDMKEKRLDAENSKQKVWEKTVHEIRSKQSERYLERFAVNAKPNQKVINSKQFIPISFELFDNSDFRNMFMTKKRFRTYLYFRRRVIRGKNCFDPLDLHFNYWISGELATSMPLGKIAKDLNLSKSTISDHIKQLEKEKIIIVDKIEASEAYDRKLHLVLILGICHNGCEEWFIDNVFKNS
jgi:DNA-binding MarR family transcriptional regulator